MNSGVAKLLAGLDSLSAAHLIRLFTVGLVSCILAMLFNIL